MRPAIDSRSRPLGLCLLGLAASLAALSLLGPLVAGVIHWRIRPTILSQLYGLDAVSLVIVAPLAAVAGVLSLRGLALGALLGVGPAAYAVYMVPQYVLGPDYAHLAGDNERWFPLVLVLFALGVVSAALAWSRLATYEPPGSRRVEALVGRRLLPAVAAVVFVRYVPTLADWMSARPTAPDYLAGPNFSWAIALSDLGVALPATAAVCIGVRHAAGWARRGLYALTGWFALVGAAVAGMAIAMQLRGDPAMSLPQMALLTVLGAVLVALAVVLYAPLLRARVGRAAGRTTAPEEPVETAGIEPASAIAPKVVSTSVAGALGLVSRSPRRRGCSRPAS